MKDINKKFKSGLLWSIIGQFGYLFVTFVANILLARLLSPKEFGIIAIATFFIVVSKVLTESGLSGALIRKNNTTEVDNSTIFIFNLIVSIALYLLLFFFSPYIENFYEIDNLSLYINVLGTVLIINSFQIIQNVRLVKKLQYRKISIYSLIAVVLSSLIAIVIAYSGYGIWALILLQVFNSLFLTSLYWLKEDGLKVFKFSKNSFRELYGFGMYTTLSSLLNTGFDNIYQLILGKYFNLGQTGFFFQARKLTEIPMGIIKSTTLGVVFSTLSSIQDNKDQFDTMYHNIIRMFTVIVGLICLALFLFSKEIIYTFYGSKWLEADFFMKILALSSFFFMQEMFNRILFKVFNQTQKIFTLEIVKKSINLISLVLGVYYKSLEILMYGYFVTCILSYFINYSVSRKVYESQSTLREMIYTLKVIFTIAIVATLYFFVQKAIVLDQLLYNLVFVLPTVFLYFYVLHLLGVLDWKKDLRLLRSLKQ